MLLATTGKDTHTPRECLLRGVCVFAVCLSLAKTLGVCLAKTLSVCGGLSVFGKDTLCVFGKDTECAWRTECG